MIDQYVYAYLGSVSAISSLVGTRIYPDILPAAPTYPAITFRAESHYYSQTFGGNAGHARSEYFIDAWATTPTGVIALGNAIRTAMKNHSGDFGGITVQQIHIESGPFNEYEDSVSAYRSTQIFSIWHSEG